MAVSLVGRSASFTSSGVEPAVGDPVDLVLEPLDVLGLLHELLLGDQEGKERLLVVAVEEFAEERVGPLPDPEPERVPDVEPLDRVADIHDLGPPEDLVVPLGEVGPGRQCPRVVVHQKRTSMTAAV